MASSSSSNTIHHSRSNSLPSWPHPVISQLEESLHSIRIALETGCSSPSSLSQKLNGLENLHESVDELLLLPLVQHAFSQQIHGGWVDELLDASLRLLDLCSTAKNSLLQTREALQELRSRMRIRKGGEQALDAEIRMYLSTRRSVQKATKRVILSLKSKKYDSASCLPGIDNEAAVFIGLLKEVEATTVALFESVFCFIAGSKPRTSSSWSIISKVMLKKRVVSKEEETDQNELFKQDMAMKSLISCRSRDIIEYPMQFLGDDVKNTNISIQDLEDGLEGLYRRLIKCRVSLLNILNH